MITATVICAEQDIPRCPDLVNLLEAHTITMVDKAYIVPEETKMMAASSYRQDRKVSFTPLATSAFQGVHSLRT